MDVQESLVGLLGGRQRASDPATMKPSVTLLSWDSRFFGQRLARLRVDRLTPQVAEVAFRFCRRQRVKGLFYLAPADDAGSIACAQNYGFRLVDLRMTYGHTLPRAGPIPSESPLDTRLCFRQARLSDVPALRRLASGLFQDSRFVVDPHFGAAASRRLFAVWVAKSVRGRYDHWVGVARRGSRLAGFVSCRRTGRNAGRIGLLGVAPSLKGRGIGRVLLGQAARWFQSQGIRRVTVVTQGRALGAQAFYQACGYRVSDIALWYHKWF